MALGSGTAEPLRPLLAALPSGSLLLCDRLDCSGAFLLPLLARAALQDGHKVRHMLAWHGCPSCCTEQTAGGAGGCCTRDVLVAATRTARRLLCATRQQVVIIAAGHTPARHMAALRKLGLLQHLGSVVCVQGDGHACAERQAGAERPAAAEAAAAAAPNTAGLCSSSGPCHRNDQEQQHHHHQQQQQQPPALQHLMQLVASASQDLMSNHRRQQVPGPHTDIAEPPSGQQGLTVLLDSLTALGALYPGQTQAAAAAFLHSCRCLGAALGAGAYRFAVIAAADVPSDGGALAALAHSADAVVQLAPVEGRTAQLDGRLELTLRRLPLASNTLASCPTGMPAVDALLPGVYTWHYRASDVAVRWLPEALDGKELMV